MTDGFEPDGFEPGGPRTFKSLSYIAMQTVVGGWPLILRAAVLPFALAVAFVVLGRWIGPPSRLFLDILHGLMVISYLTSVARIVMGTYPGFGLVGLAVPQPSWPGGPIARSIAADALVLMVPTGFVLYIFAINFGPMVMMLESTVLNVAGTLALEFILNTLLGLVIGAGMARYTQEQQDSAHPDTHDT